MGPVALNRRSSHWSTSYSTQPIAELRDPPAPRRTGCGKVGSCHRLEGLRRLSIVLSEHESFAANAFLRRMRLARAASCRCVPGSAFGEATPIAWVIVVSLSFITSSQFQSGPMPVLRPRWTEFERLDKEGELVRRTKKAQVFRAQSDARATSAAYAAGRRTENRARNQLDDPTGHKRRRFRARVRKRSRLGRSERGWECLLRCTVAARSAPSVVALRA